MSNPTATYYAKTLYSELLSMKVIDYSTHGLVGNRLYISTGARAYRLEELSDGHLDKIVAKNERDKGEVPHPLKMEVMRRKELAESEAQAEV